MARMKYPARLAPIALALFGLACSGPATRPVPVRTSPVPTSVGTLAVPTDAVLDLASTAPTWYDATLDRVMRLEGSTLTPVQDRGLAARPDTLRVFADGSIAYLLDVELHLLPADGSAEVVDTFGGMAVAVAFDGVAWDDLWYAVGGPTGDDAQLCHRTATATDCVTAVPALGGYTLQVGVARDGSIYVTDRGDTIYRYADGALAEVGSIDGGIAGFRASATGVVVRGGLSQVFTLVGTTLVEVGANAVIDAVGTSEGLIVAERDLATEQVDPSCQPSFFAPCPSRTVWEELVITERTASGTRELGHETCETDGIDEGCGRITLGVALDGDRVVLMGTPLRTVAR